MPIYHRDNASSDPALLTLMDGLPLAMALLGEPGGRVLKLNRAFVDLFGYSGEEVARECDWWRLAYPDPAARLEAQQAWETQVLPSSGGGPSAPGLDTQVTCGNGSTRFVRMALTRLGTEQVISFTDRGGRRPAGEGMLASESLYRELLERQGAGFGMVDGDERFLVVNPVAEQIFGVAPGQLKGRSLWDFIPAEQQELIRQESQLRAQGLASTYELQIRREDGTLGTLLVTATPRPQREGEPPQVIGVFRDITENKAIEEALRESEARFRGLLHGIESVAVQGYTADGTIRYWNKASERFYGYTAEEALGRNLLDLIIPPDMRGEVRAAIADMAATGRPIPSDELPLMRKDGSRIVVYSSHASVQISGREPELFCMDVDLTERKRAEAALALSQAELKAIYDHSPVMMCVVGSDYQVLYSNPALQAFTGASQEVLSEGRPGSVLHCIHALRQPGGCGFTENCEACPLRLALDDTFRTGSTHQNIDVQATLMRGGEPRKVALLASTSLFQAGGQKHLLLCLNDITERIEAEEALKASAARLRVIFEASEAGIVLVSPTGEIQFANGRTADMVGLTLPQLIGTQYADHLHESEKMTGDVRMRMLIDGVIPMVSLERRYVRADGTDFWGHLSGRRLENPDGSLRALVGIITDISKRREAEEEQRSLQAQLHQAQKMESLGALAGGVAHDMNNVLGAILGLASAHIEVQPTGSPVRQAFGTIIKAAERGGNLLKSLLSFARQSSSEVKDLDLNAVLREEVRLLERTTLSKVRLVLELAEDLRPIRGDAGALTHAFMNLCVNAVDAMPDSGTLTLRTRNLNGRWVEVQVQDTGTGMTKEVLDRALDPFFTTKDVGKGTGLGLPMVYSTVKTYEGEMELRSEPGLGTCVVMRFPACEAAQRSHEASGANRILTSRGSLAVLLVDDDELIQNSMLGMLEMLGHAPTLATSGEVALAKLEAGLNPDVIILDMNMPGLGGAGTLPRIRALHPTVPVLLATGRADQTAQELIHSHRHVTLISKPFGMKELQAYLDAFVG